jgi:hypothetical protein
MLCLDWREICDGVEQCLEGKDEENCDLLEMNQCDDDDEEEYRCRNGMCIADQFVLDREWDCLDDWSDEIQFQSSFVCHWESVSDECDDHLCLLNHFPCGDGECIENRLHSQQWVESIRASRRDEHLICETHSK